jgi:hypothetical protein
MSITKVKKKMKKYPTKWDEAIADAKRKIADLKSSIAYFRQRRKAGDQWPVESATQN